MERKLSFYSNRWGPAEVGHYAIDHYTFYKKIYNFSFMYTTCTNTD